MEEFKQKGCTGLVVYNHHFAPSNDYYHKLGGQVIRQEEQGRDKLLIDVIKFDVDDLMSKLQTVKSSST